MLDRDLEITRDPAAEFAVWNLLFCFEHFLAGRNVVGQTGAFGGFTPVLQIFANQRDEHLWMRKPGRYLRGHEPRSFHAARVVDCGAVDHFADDVRERDALIAALRSALRRERERADTERRGRLLAEERAQHAWAIAATGTFRPPAITGAS